MCSHQLRAWLLTSGAANCAALTSKARATLQSVGSESAEVAGLHPEASYVLLYDAARNCLSAVLAATGKRVSEGRGAHLVTITEAGRILASEPRSQVAPCASE
jgi:hypothetical protein